MKIQQLVLPFLPGLLLLLTTLPSAADVIQTQPATEVDVEADVIKAAAKEGIFTVQIAYRNKGNSEVRIGTVSATFTSSIHRTRRNTKFSKTARMFFWRRQTSMEST